MPTMQREFSGGEIAKTINESAPPVAQQALNQVLRMVKAGASIEPDVLTAVK